MLSSVDPVELAREIEHVALKVMATEGLSASFYVRGSGINLSRQLQHRTGFQGASEEAHAARLLKCSVNGAQGDLIQVQPLESVALTPALQAESASNCTVTREVRARCSNGGYNCGSGDVNVGCGMFWSCGDGVQGCFLYFEYSEQCQYLCQQCNQG